ncbi:MAG: META domain-containing protein [Rhodobacteraceae bacterium]|nr:META domain-containing protein [Paracoccaceae bacterium]
MPVLRPALCLVVALSASAVFADDPDPLAAGPAWRLVQLNGSAFTARARFSIAVDRRLAGQAPCNSFFGAIDGTAAAFHIGPLAATRNACADLAAESAFFQALEAARQARIDGGRLVMTGDDGVELVFAPSAPD